MNQQILRYLKDYSYDTWDVNRLLVSCFLTVNGIVNVENKFIRSFIISEDDKVEYLYLEKFISYFTTGKFTIEDLIELFEFVISPVDKEINGAVYTPSYIRKYIVDRSIEKRILGRNHDLNNFIFADIACGCGGFFKTIAEYFRTTTNKSYYEIYDVNLFGLDIQEYSIIRTKILLSLIAISDNEDLPEFRFNLFCGDALCFDWHQIEFVRENGGFDIIVGNPPYVGVTKMTEVTKSLLKKWAVSLTGKPDLYIPFFEVALTYLNSHGILGYITVNTFFKSLNGRLLRAFFSQNKFDLCIVDFGGEQVFRNRSTYTCICIVNKQPSENIRFIKSSSTDIETLSDDEFVSIRYSDLDDYTGWHLTEAADGKQIIKLETAGTPLGNLFKIRNGFATLKNNVFVFKPVIEDERYYYFEKDNVSFKVEKDVCRDAIKPNILKSEEEIFEKTEKVIFPYEIIRSPHDLFGSVEGKLSIFEEAYFKHKFPFAYNYLQLHSEILLNRDRGKKKYEKWYAFGRNQALTIQGYKLLFPYITKEPCFVFTEDKDLLFYNGYAIVSNSRQDLLVAQKILMSNLFWFYITRTSKPYSGNFFSVAKNYIKNFSICSLTDDERGFLLETDDRMLIEEFLEKKYSVKVVPLADPSMS